ncbi:glycerophosphodiester phosphodiesterase [Methyloprofundus sp.]|uniref:glycerophosphodiester phosphodiesterase n=1 Tax=Methyloprofundus sp. TaxID=2020875 RepID=UPI003D12913F
MRIEPLNFCNIYAHRGARLEAADNTRKAFEKALLYPVDGMETDVQLTKDSVSVLWHDRYLDKLGYPGKHIDDFTFAELQQFNFAAFFTGAEEEGVFSLQAFVNQYRGRCKLQIEIKNREWETLQRQQKKVQQCLEILGSAHDLDVFISSFNLHSLQYAHRLSTDIELVYAVDESDKISDIITTVSENHFLAGICQPIATLNEELADFLREHNKLIVTYTCNTGQDIQKALDLNVDILITDDPAKAIHMRG